MRKQIVRKEYYMNKIFRTVINVLDCKINELGLYRKLDHGLGWINKQNPIMKLLYEKGE